jgi:hypothetical protein
MRRDLGHLAGLLALVSALVACGNAPCARHSDCPTGLSCSATSVCIVAVDAAVDDGGATGGTTDAASAADAATDASTDAPTDAPSTTDAAPNDAPADGGP